MPNFPLSIFEDEEENTLPVSGNGSFGLMPTNINLGEPKYQCHSCEQPDCSEETICSNAYQVISLSKFLYRTLTYSLVLVLEISSEGYFRTRISVERLYYKSRTSYTVLQYFVI